MPITATHSKKFTTRLTLTYLTTTTKGNLQSRHSPNTLISRFNVAKMSSSDFSVDQFDLEKLNEKDRAELSQFFANETQRSKIQSRT
jgi:hypothetical protein